MFRLKEKYFVDEKEYSKLSSKGVLDGTIWYLHKSLIHRKLNYLFEQNNFLSRLIFDYGYNELLTSKNSYGLIGDFHGFDFDHTISIRLVEDDSIRIQYKDTVTGILTFPYLNWTEVEEWISKTPKNWEVYLINPCLLSYHPNTIGLFLTPIYHEGFVISNFNHYCIKLTGYPFFLKYTTDIYDVTAIEKLNLKLNRNNFVEEYKNKSDCDEGLSILLEFWRDNPCVHCSNLDEAYLDYLDVQQYHTWRNINLMEISSDEQFVVMHKDTGEELGRYYNFSLDKQFNIIDTERGEQKLTDEEANDLLNGKYKYKIINI